MASLLPDTELGLPERTLTEQVYGHEEKSRGAVPTRQEVVDFMLDLIGYTTDKPLHQQRLLEPSFGDGRFVLSVVERVLIAWREHGGSDYRELLTAIRAVELDEATFKGFRQGLEDRLVGHGFKQEEAHELAETWIVQADFLWADFDEHFHYVIIAMSYEVFFIFAQHPAVLEQYKYTVGGPVTQEQILNLFRPYGITNLYVGTAVQDTSVEGLTTDLAPVWGKDVVFACVTPRPGLKEINGGYKFSLREGRYTMREEIVKPPLTEVVIHDYYCHEILVQEAFYVIKNAIA